MRLLLGGRAREENGSERSAPTGGSFDPVKVHRGRAIFDPARTMNDTIPLLLDGVLETSLCAPDLDAAEPFYRDVLGLRVVARQPGRHVFFRCGRTMLLLFNPAQTAFETVSVGGRPIPKHGTQGAGHVAFAVEMEALSAWRDRLRQAGITIEAEVDWPQGGRSLYVRDPAGNSVELATPSIWPHLMDAAHPDL
jgi:catechol 2,3-dioxygenase-like lactoylglutathione lyase family enzyme